MANEDVQTLMIDLQNTLTDIDSGVYRIPNFQRNYVWKIPDVKKLLDSIFHEYPAGSLLILNVDEEISITSDPFNGAPQPTSKCTKLVLDGQQRLTSCYHVFFNRHRSNRYYIDLKKLFNKWKETPNKEDIAFADCIEVRPKSSNIEFNSDHLVSFIYLRSQEVYSDFRSTYFYSLCDRGESKEYKDFIMKNLDNLLSSFFKYKFVSMELSYKIGLSAVCRIFETLNNTGQKLDSFDICVAKFIRDKINLKNWIETAKNEYPTMNVLFDNDKNREYPLQVIALWKKAKSHLKNRLVEELTSQLIDSYWADAIMALDKAMQILDDYGACTRTTMKYISYPVMIPVIAAALLESNFFTDNSQESAIRNHIQVYFYICSLNELYTQGAASTMKKHYDALCTWFRPPFTVPDFIEKGVDWNARKLLELPNKISAKSCAFYCILNDMEPKDFITKTKVKSSMDGVELHHIFPKAAYPSTIKTNLALNMAYLLKSSNIKIGNKTTVNYSKSVIQETYSGSEQAYKSAVMTQAISEAGYDAFIQEDYDLFIRERLAMFFDAFRNLGIKINPVETSEDNEVTDDI